MVLSSSGSNFLFPVTRSKKIVTESLLRFHLVPETTALITITQLREVLKVDPRRIVPIPKLPPWLVGVYNWRGEILWVVDLGGFLGLTPLSEQSLEGTTLPLLVLKDEANQAAKSKTLGVIVKQVQGISRIDPHEIQSPPESTFTPELGKVLRGYALSQEGEMLMVLSAAAIFAQMPNASDQ